MASTDSEQALGKDKSNIYAVLSKLIFTNHAKYGTGYHWNPKKFCNSVANHIVGLKVRYKKLKARLGATGPGVLPGDNNPPIDPCLLQPLPPLSDIPSPTGPDVTTGPPPPNNYIGPSAAHHAPPPHFDPPQAHLRSLSRTNDLMQDDMMGYNSPLKVTGKKWHSFASPSPSPPPNPQPFHLLTKAPTNPYHSHAAFGQLLIQGHHKLLSMSCNLLTPSSTTHNMTPSSSSTPQTLVSAQLDSGKKKKKAKLDVQDQVENLMEEFKSIQSDVMSLWHSKH
ncbi:uncharacterized protein BJ212DRAFT_1481101 [Suillus subaureus]|uniref:Uncharacterized protein n=1 Tax=Suillus subaureus TaxID=48587 RepID=A0A9P7JDG7_9AGAM|nr:uncharacterized protein BJ212DRAFT_1481101 [Suillus subaureus]KAG1816028.1 hypothetical protein BJ212DRAFT_1481101 [Suillus subaureus]